MSNREEVVFCTDPTDEPEEHRRVRAYFPTGYEIVVRPDQREYDTNASSDPEEARRIIEQARKEEPSS